jgi:cell division protein FtsB
VSSIYIPGGVFLPGMLKTCCWDEGIMQKWVYFCIVKKILPYIKNKYLLTVIGLAVWVIFFDKNDLKTQLELRQKVKQLEKERDYFSQEISIINNEIKELTTNPKTLEKFAREKYLMKRDNEDIFVIVEQSQPGNVPQ